MYPQRANVPLQDLDRHALTMGAISGSRCQTGALNWCHFTSCGFTWSTKSTLEKQTKSILASGGNEYASLFSVAISWGNKVNFSLYVNMLGFCSTVTYFKYCLIVFGIAFILFRLYICETRRRRRRWRNGHILQSVKNHKTFTIPLKNW